MKNVFEQRKPAPEGEDDISIDVVFEDENISPETAKAIEYIEEMRREMAELEFSGNARDREKLDYLQGELARFEELGEINDVII